MADGVMLTTAAPVTAAAAPVEDWFVVVMGLVTVFVCLVLLIVLCKLMGAVVKSFAKKESTAPAAPAAPAASTPAQDVLPQQLIAAISAAIAEDMNTTPAGLRILSIKKK